MKVTSAILQHDLIGLKAKVAKSASSDHVNIDGKVLDETRNTVTILHKNRRKRILKSAAVFHFTFPDGTIVEVDGQSIVGRPENRIKKRVKRRW